MLEQHLKVEAFVAAEDLTQNSSKYRKIKQEREIISLSLLLATFSNSSRVALDREITVI